MQRVIVTVKRKDEARVHDVDVPANVESERLADLLARALRWESDHSGQPMQYVVEAHPLGRVLDPDESLWSAGVWDGSWLVLHPIRVEPEPQPVIEPPEPLYSPIDRFAPAQPSTPQGLTTAPLQGEPDLQPGESPETLPPLPIYTTRPILPGSLFPFAEETAEEEPAPAPTPYQQPVAPQEPVAFEQPYVQQPEPVAQQPYAQPEPVAQQPYAQPEPVVPQPFVQQPEPSAPQEPVFPVFRPLQWETAHEPEMQQDYYQQVQPSPPDAAQPWAQPQPAAQSEPQFQPQPQPQPQFQQAPEPVPDYLQAFAQPQPEPQPWLQAQPAPPVQPVQSVQPVQPVEPAPIPAQELYRQPAPYQGTPLVAPPPDDDDDAETGEALSGWRSLGLDLPTSLGSHHDEPVEQSSSGFVWKQLDD
jgi:hypothetical protein